MTATKKPEFVRLMDASRETVLDMVATEYEDSFCLDSFGDLVEAAQEADPEGKKHFIIARVQTWDHKQPDRAFYSYYHAHHLNKILFQTQVYLDKKLIHRLHVLNPLTNTDIIGNVLYFMVVGKTVKKKKVTVRVEPPPSPAKVTIPGTASGASGASSTTAKTTSGLMINTHANTYTNSGDYMPPPSPSVQNLPKLSNPVDLNLALHNRDPLTSMASSLAAGDIAKSSEKTGGQLGERGWTVTNALAQIDEAEVVPTSPRHDVLVSPLRSGPPNPLRAVAVSISRKMGTKRGGMQQLGSDGRGNGLELDTTAKGGQFTAGPMSASVVEHSRFGVSAAQWDQNAPPQSPGGAGAYPMTPTAEGSSRMQSLAPAGTVTQHGKALTPIQALEVVPKTKPGHRRSFSYMNTVVAMNGDATSAGISPNGRHVLDARDWVRTLKAHDEALSQMSEMERQLAVASGKFDVVLAPTITSAEPLLPSAPTLTSRPEGILDEIEVDDGTFYDAVLIATDNDFLETSATRAIFRENAVNPADCTLFEMPPFTGDEQADAERRLALEMQDMPLPCDSLCCPTDQQLRAMTRTGRWFHMVKCYLMVMIVTVIVVALIFTATTSRSS